MTVADELEHVLFFVTDVLYRAMPPFYEDIRTRSRHESTAKRPSSSKYRPCALRLLGRRRHGRQPERQRQNDSRDAGAAALADSRPVLQRMCGDCRQAQSVSGLRELSARACSTRSMNIAACFRTPTTPCPHVTGTCPTAFFCGWCRQRLQSTYDDDVFPYEKVDELVET